MDSTKMILQRIVDVLEDIADNYAYSEDLRLKKKIDIIKRNVESINFDGDEKRYG